MIIAIWQSSLLKDGRCHRRTFKCACVCVCALQDIATVACLVTDMCRGCFESKKIAEVNFIFKLYYNNILTTYSYIIITCVHMYS